MVENLIRWLNIAICLPAKVESVMVIQFRTSTKYIKLTI